MFLTDKDNSTVSMIKKKVSITSKRCLLSSNDFTKLFPLYNIIPDINITKNIRVVILSEMYIFHPFLPNLPDQQILGVKFTNKTQFSSISIQLVYLNGTVIYITISEVRKWGTERKCWTKAREKLTRANSKFCIPMPNDIKRLIGWLFLSLTSSNAADCNAALPLGLVQCPVCSSP